MAPSTAPQAQPKKQSLSSPLPGQGTSPLHNWRPLSSMTSGQLCLPHCHSSWERRQKEKMLQLLTTTSDVCSPQTPSLGTSEQEVVGAEGHARQRVRNGGETNQAGKHTESYPSLRHAASTKGEPCNY